MNNLNIKDSRDIADVDGFLKELAALTRKYKLIIRPYNEYEPVLLDDLGNQDGEQWRYWIEDRFDLTWSDEDPWKPLPIEKVDPANIIVSKWTDEPVLISPLSGEEMDKAVKAYHEWKRNNQDWRSL